jgi:hypothetical protein
MIEKDNNLVVKPNLKWENYTHLDAPRRIQHTQSNNARKMSSRTRFVNNY